MPVVTAANLLIIAISTVIVTSIGRLFFGAEPSFNVPSLSIEHGLDSTLLVLPWFALFGLLLGVLAWAFTRGIYWFEDRFDSMPGNYYTRRKSGMLIVGLLMNGFVTLSQRAFGQSNHYY